MRELKFRAWYENVKRGREINGELVWGIESYYDYDPVIDNNGLLDVEAGWDIHGHSDEKYVVEQYTGLKDKNGKEIYEGDIVEEDIDFNSKMIDGTFRYRVYWDECLCWALDPIGEESVHDELWQTNLSRRVIGNIHENHELLEEEEC